MSQFRPLLHVLNPEMLVETNTVSAASEGVIGKPIQFRGVMLEEDADNILQLDIYDGTTRVMAFGQISIGKFLHFFTAPGYVPINDPGIVRGDGGNINYTIFYTEA